jgi:hypothetical protein
MKIRLKHILILFDKLRLASYRNLHVVGRVVCIAAVPVP